MIEGYTKFDDYLQEKLKKPEFNLEWKKLNAENKIMEIIEKAGKKSNKNIDRKKINQTVEDFINIVADLDIEELAIKLA